MIQQTSQLSLLDTIKEGKINKRQQQILDVFNNFDNLNDDWKSQILQQGFSINNRQLSYLAKLPINVICPRVLELRKLGKIIEHKKMVDECTNRLTIYWRLA